MTELDPQTEAEIGPAIGATAIDPGQQLSRQIARRLRELIMSGEAPGDSPLRTEHLAARFGVSATPVREALMSLHGEGLVDLRPGRGFRVVPINRQDLIDIFDAQAYFAGELAGRAATRLSDEDLEKIQYMQDEIIKAIERNDPDAEIIEFRMHQLINRASQAAKLQWLLKIAMRYAQFRAWSTVKDWSTATPEDHLPLLRGLSHRSPRIAQDAMTAHIRNIAELLANHLAEQGILSDESRVT